MVGPVAAFVAATVDGGIAWLRADRGLIAQIARNSRSRLARRRTFNDAGRPGENRFRLSLILATTYHIEREIDTEISLGAWGAHFMKVQPAPILDGPTAQPQISSKLLRGSVEQSVDENRRSVGGSHRTEPTSRSRQTRKDARGQTRLVRQQRLKEFPDHRISRSLTIY